MYNAQWPVVAGPWRVWVCRRGCAQAIWIYTCFIHRFSMERIKDYFMMFLHHLLTIALFCTGYWSQFVSSAGVCILAWCHAGHGGGTVTSALALRKILTPPVLEVLTHLTGVCVLHVAPVAPVFQRLATTQTT